jgi:uncharacterized protein YfaT (DUF1175 family)
VPVRILTKMQLRYSREDCAGLIRWFAEPEVPAGGRVS